MSPTLMVIGDVLLDVDVLTTAERLMPDAPVPVLDEIARRERPGGAALAALLAARDERVDVMLVAPIPDDVAGRTIRRLLDGIVEVVGLPCSGSTPVKTRLRAGGHTVARVDAGGKIVIGSVPEAARAALRGASGVLVSDYGAATTSDDTVRALLRDCAGRTATVWDPHPRGGEPVPGIGMVTPNAREAETAAAADSPVGAPERATDIARARRSAERLLTRWRSRSVVVTLGARGALLCFGTGSSEMFAAPQASSGDTCGAGDCFSAAAAIDLALGALPSEAVAHAVGRASAFITAGGVGTLDDPTAEPPSTRPSAEEVVDRVRSGGGTVVATGGCFDLMHAGHIETLAAARALGDCLIVCLNSDESVRRLKGAPRPVQSETDRARVLGALRDVDAVAIFAEDTPERLLSELRPDIWVKGGDYTGDRLPESETVRSWGGEVVTVGYLDGRSTSRLLARVQQ